MAEVQCRTHSEASDVPLQPHIGEVRHEVGHHLEASVLGQLKGLTHSIDCVATVGVSGYVLIHTLDSDLQSCAAVGEHLAVCV